MNEATRFITVQGVLTQAKTMPPQEAQTSDDLNYLISHCLAQEIKWKQKGHHN
jgi:hypothetical protein